MRVGIDAHALGTRAGGNETFVRQLLVALARAAVGDVHFTALVGPGHRDGVADGIDVCRLPVQLSYLRVPVFEPWAAWRNSLDLLHAQYIAPPVCPCACVATVHDLTWKHYPEYLRAVDRYRLEWLIPRTMRQCVRIFCDSLAVKNEICDVYGVAPEKVDVTPIAVDPVFAADIDPERLAGTRRKYRLPEHYVLYVGALQPRKNIGRVAAAVARLRDRGLPHALVITGRPTWLYKDLLAEIEALKLGDRLVFTDFADSADLPAIYRGADAFAYVSFYEGFGLPVLEALAAGVPTVASTDPAIMEITGTAAAVHCDPNSVDAIEDALYRALTNEALRAQLAAAGPVRAAEFSYQRMAETTLAGYRKALAT